MIIDIILGCSFGHEGKGKVAYDLCKGREYDLCVRFNGSEYASHTMHTTEGQKWILHQLPTGVLFPKMYNLICGDSVINIEKLFEEIRILKQHGIDVAERLFISKSCIVVASMYENGMINRVEDNIDLFIDMGIEVVDMHYFWDMFNKNLPINNHNVLIEGTGGFELDKNWGDHELSSSVSCTLGGAINIGINIQDIRNIYGVSSAYYIYVGNNKREVAFDDSLNMLEDMDSETDRPWLLQHKTYSYMNLDRLCNALKVNNCNICIINKADIIQYLGIYRLVLHNNKIHIFENFQEMEMEMLIYKIIKQKVSPNIRIVFSYSEYVI